LPKLEEIICAAYRAVRTTLAARRELQAILQSSDMFRYTKSSASAELLFFKTSDPLYILTVM
jgi:hypothetical protein